MGEYSALEARKFEDPGDPVCALDVVAITFSGLHGQVEHGRFTETIEYPGDGRTRWPVPLRRLAQHRATSSTRG